MHLLLIRHAIAEDREDFARTDRSDDQRPLTDEGREKMRQGAAGLREIVPALDLLATSPFVRAAETASIVAEAYGRGSPATVDALVPTREPSALLDWLRTQRAGAVAVVGHEPHLSRFVSWMLTGSERPILEIKKGGAVMLDCGERPQSGDAVLLWSLTPRQLRRLAR